MCGLTRITKVKLNRNSGQSDNADAFCRRGFGAENEKPPGRGPRVSSLSDITDWVGAINRNIRASVLATGRVSPANAASEWTQSGTMLSFSRRNCDLLAFGLDCSQSSAMDLQSPKHISAHSKIPDKVAFSRAEISTIMGLYGRMVAAGEWRDYGMSFLQEVAVFSVFKRAAENPIYRIEKRPKLRMKQGLYAVIGMDGQVLKRGQDLKSVLRVLERKLIRVVD